MEKTEDENEKTIGYSFYDYKQLIMEVLDSINDEKFLRSIWIILKSYKEKRGL